MRNEEILREMARNDRSVFVCFINKLLGVDGGPGSGNFGHRGRPGKRGGSGPGGGKQYRGGRADIGYFGSRKDWLNGLSGEKQDEATKALKDFKNDYDHKLKAKNVIEKHWKEGLITADERDEALKKGRLEDLRDNMTTEEYVMKCGSSQDTYYLLNLAKRARNWDQYKDRLIADNLSDEEEKIYRAMKEKQYDDGIWASSELWKGALAIEQYEAKAMGLVDFDIDVPDEIQYRLGVKERPPEPAKTGPDYGWVNRVTGSNELSSAAHYIGVAIGEVQPYAHRYTPEEFADVNQKFLDTLAYGNMSPNEVAYYSVNAIRDLRNSLNLAKKDPSSGWQPRKPYEYTKENFDRLTDDEKEKLLDLTNRLATMHDFAPTYKQNVEDLTEDDFLRAESNIRHMTPRKKDERRIIQDYMILQNKLLTGAEPTPKEEVEAKKRAEQEAKAAAEQAEKAKKEAERNAKASAWKSKHTPEQIQKMMHPEKIAGVSRGKDMNISEADNSNANPDRLKHTNRERGNCQTCVVAYELRRRGYNVIAKPRNRDAETELKQFELAASRTTGKSAWIDPETGEPPQYTDLPANKRWTAKTAAKWFDSQVKDGERYTLSVCWKSRGAHIINVERENGEVAFIDPQDGSKSRGLKAIEWYLGSVKCNSSGNKWQPRLTRIDNALPNPEYYDKILLPGRSA